MGGVVWSAANIVIPKLGSLRWAMEKCPGQFPTDNPVLYAPRFFGFDGAADFFGLMGYYASIPSWREYQHNSTPPNDYACYQAATFNIAGGNVYNNLRLLSNPFRYAAAGEMPLGQNLGGLYTSPAIPGFNYIHLTNVYGYADSGVTAVSRKTVQQMLPNQSLLFSNAAASFAAPINVSYASFGAPYDWRSYAIPFVLMADGFQENLIDHGVTYEQNNSAPIFRYGSLWSGYSFSSSQESLPAVKTLMREGIPRLINNLADVGIDNISCPTDPLSGRAYYYGTPPSGGLNFYFTDVIGPGDIPPLFSIATRFSLSVAADNTALQNAGRFMAMKNLPGGGVLMLAPTGDNYMSGFIILKNNVGYYSITLTNTPSYFGLSFINDMYGVDLDGIIYMIDASTTPQTLYWTGPSTLKINIALASLPRWGVSCQPFDPCAA